MSGQSNIFAEFTSLVEKAAFVTVDTELSGLTEDRNNITSLDEYLLLLRDGVTTYSMLQVGFCLAVYCSSTPNGKWMLYPYNFYVYPSDDCVMHLRSSTVTWLHAQGFNFMRWISEGRGYRRLECEASTSGRSKRQKKVNRYGLQRYLEVIKKHNKPLVVHNGLLDLLHLYDKFIGVIPELPGDICNALYTKLGPGIYDTKYVSRTLQSLGIQETLKVNSLETIYRYYDELVKFGNITEICDTESHLNYSKCFSKAGMSKLALVHEAGFDALLTARVFAGQISLITKADSLPPDYVPVHSDDPTDMGTTLSAVINRVNIHDQIGIECVNLLTGTG